MHKPNFRPWIEDVRGTTAAIFAFFILPILLVVSFTLDMSRQIGAKHRAIAAADFAVLAGARAMQDASLTDDEIKHITISALQSNLAEASNPPSCSKVEPEVDTEQTAVTLAIDCTIETVFPSYFHGADSLSIAHTSEAKIILPTMDIALMLDLSGTMLDGSRLEDLKAAAKSLVETLVTAQTGDRVRVALIPYETAVNAGVYGNRAQGRNDHDDSDHNGDKVCVSQRANLSSRYTDHAPVAFHRVGNLIRNLCSDSMIVPLTSDTNKLNSEIDAINTTATAGTAGHLGLAWSWYAISSKWSEIWPEGAKPVENDSPYARKVVVMMTDGVFNRHATPLVWFDDRAEIEIAPETAKAYCTNMREQGITIYAIGLDVQDPSIGITHSLSRDEEKLEEWLDQYGPRQLLSYCAGDPSRFSEPEDSSELVGIYTAVAEQLRIESVALTE